MRVQKFFNEMFGEVTVLKDETGEILFVANEIAEVLGYQNLSSAILRHTAPEDRKTLHFGDYPETRFCKIWKSGDFRPKTLINESGVYCMIFGSKLESAKVFKRWVTSEVLPSIRQNGGYIEGQEGLDVQQKKALMTEIREMQNKVTYLQQRRHAIRADLLKERDDKRKLKAKNKDLAKSRDAYRKECSEQLDRYISLIEENERLERKAHAERMEQSDILKPIFEAKEERPTIKVDACGFIIY